ncbi:MAG: heme ABC exporter ATP-binding protein CcmA [Polyangiales bacterium]
MDAVDKSVLWRADNVVKFFGATAVLRGVSLTLRRGECVVLRGGNGAGKSTLLRIAAGLLRPDEGQVGMQAGAPQRRDVIALLAHTSGVYPELSGRENLAMFARLGIDVPQARIASLLDTFALQGCADRAVAHYSRGQLQRLALARVLLPEPALILLDEPTTGLDRSSQAVLLRELSHCKARGAALLMATHAPALEPGLADRNVTLTRGRVQEDTCGG